MSQINLSTIIIFPFLVSISLLTTACYQTADLQCHYSSDCAQSSYCRAGQCISASNRAPNGNHNLEPESETHDTSNNESNTKSNTDASPPPPAQPCPAGRPPQPGDLVLNEFLVNVPSGPAGDANGDGVRHPHDDEFVELVNLTPDQLDLSGVKIQNASNTKYTFTRFCLDAGHAAVVFGGLEPGATLPAGPGFHAMIAHSRFMFNNEQGTIVVRTPDNRELLQVSYERAPPQALTLSPELHGTHFVPHSSRFADTLFSPGLCTNNLPLTSGCPPDDFSEIDVSDADYPDIAD